MNESVCSGLCAQLKGSIKECFRDSTVLDRMFGSWCTEESARAKENKKITPEWHDGKIQSVCR